MSTVIYDLMHVISRKGTFFMNILSIGFCLSINLMSFVFGLLVVGLTTSLENVAKKEVGEEYRFYV